MGVNVVNLDPGTLRAVQEIKKVKNGAVEVVIQNSKIIRIFRKDNIDVSKIEENN